MWGYRMPRFLQQEHHQQNGRLPQRKNLEDEVQVIATGCFGFCEKGPIVKIMPDNTFYTQVKPEDAEEIINEHIIKRPESRTPALQRSGKESGRKRLQTHGVL